MLFIVIHLNKQLHLRCTFSQVVYCILQYICEDEGGVVVGQEIDTMYIMRCFTLLVVFVCPPL